MRVLTVQNAEDLREYQADKLMHEALKLRKETERMHPREVTMQRYYDEARRELRDPK